jgi:hypothetical protein
MATLDLKALAVILDDGASAAEQLDDAALHATLAAMAETAVAIADDESLKREWFAALRTKYNR